MNKVTIKDVAREAGVSPSLVSIVLNAKMDSDGNYDCNINKDTAKRVMETAKRLNYRRNKAAASLRNGKRFTIGLITSDIANKFFADIARYVENVAHENGYLVLFGSSDEKTDKLEELIDAFLSSGVDGLIIAPCGGSREVLQRTVDTSIPIVLLDRDIEDLTGVGRVMMDNVKAGEMAVENLYGNGYRKIEMISYTLGISSMECRKDGYMNAMSRFGLDSFTKVHYTNYGRAKEDIFNIIKDAVARGVEALILPTNTISSMGLHAVCEMKLSIPEDLALLCFDESEIYDIFTPSITQVVQSTKDFGEKSFLMLKNMIENKECCLNEVIEPELIVGESTSPKKSAGDMKRSGISSLSAADSVLVTGTSFADKGGWIADPQFMETMGSSYMIAHGLGTPVQDAVTEFEVPNSGYYHVFVRTRNWTSDWSDKPTPGVFSVLVDNQPVSGMFGNGSSAWSWQNGGTVKLTKGRHELRVHDFTGFDARFDSILFTTEDYVPDDGVETVYMLRNTLLALPVHPEMKGKYDFVVCGGGVAGMCAAIAAARLGLSVALIQDRKILGGNNSSEVRVGLGGRLNIGRYPSLGYLLNEFGPDKKGNARPAETYEDGKKLQAVLSERNIDLYLGYKVTKVNKNVITGKIESVIATDVDTYEQIEICSDLFSDCTGDATVGVLAGAEWRMGREARSEYNEPSAPDKEDGMTLGASVQWYSEEADSPTVFPDIDWGLSIDERSVQKVRRGQWYWEVGMMDDMIADAEKIRDYGMYVVYSNWSYIKNHSSFKEEYANSYLGWVSYVAGKRESRRLMGDFVLKENDLRQFVQYADGCVSTSWYIDNHVPDPDNSALYPGREWLSQGRLTPLDFYPIPYRCFYSKNVGNLFMAGRNISVSHIALGTVRVMRTTAMMGEVVGMAASICHRRNCLPRDVYEKYFDELEQLMKKGTGRTDVPYMQVYTLIDTTAARSEDC